MQKSVLVRVFNYLDFSDALPRLQTTDLAQLIIKYILYFPMVFPSLAVGLFGWVFLESPYSLPNSLGKSQNVNVVVANNVFCLSRIHSP